MRVLVTGGSGFIGSHVVDRLLMRGHQPTRSSTSCTRARHDPDAVECVTGDILDGSALRAAMRACDAVIHLAAVADVDQVALDPLRADLVNTPRHARSCSRPPATSRSGHVVYGSTIWVYGNAPRRAGARRGRPARHAGPLLHGDEAGRGDVLPLLRGGCSASRRRSCVSASRTGRVRARPRWSRRSSRALARRADQHQRRRQPGAPVRVRRGSRRRHRRGALRRGARPDLQPRRRRDGERAGDRGRSCRRWSAMSTIVHVPGRQADLAQVRISRRAGATPSSAGVRPRASPTESRATSQWLAGTNGSPSASTRSMINGSAATVLRQESGAL